MRVLDVVHDPLHDLGEERLHLFVTALAGGGDGHQGRVPVLPVLIIRMLTVSEPSTIKSRHSEVKRTMLSPNNFNY